MSLQVACPHCDSHLSLSTKPGEQVRCPMCHQVFVTPRTPAAPAPQTATPVQSFPSHFQEPSPHPQGPGGFQTGSSFGYYRPTSGLAIASMVLGIISLVGFCIWFVSIPCGIIAVILGALGTAECSGANARCIGGGMAVAGLILGALGIGFWALFVLVAGMTFSPFHWTFGW